MIFDADSPGAPFSDLSAGVRIGETIFIAGDEGTSIERLVPGRRNSWTQTASYRLDTMIELPGGNADEIDIERSNARQHLSFGFGLHRCMGNRLAELQLRILWEEILVRFDKIDVQEEPSRTFSSFVKGYTSLPVNVRRKV